MSVVNDGIICFKCRKEGHKVRECPENNKSNAKEGSDKRGTKQKEKKKCYRCSKVGHITMNCWEDEKNTSKRQENWKSVNASASGMVMPAVNGGNKVEYLLCGMCFPSNIKLLNDPNMWIVDMAATVYSMLYSMGLQNPKEASSSDSVTMGNDTDVRPKTIVQLPGVICDKHGNELLKGAVLNNVMHLPEAKYNLFSLSRMTRHEG